MLLRAFIACAVLTSSLLLGEGCSDDDVQPTDATPDSGPIDGGSADLTPVDAADEDALIVDSGGDLPVPELRPLSEAEAAALAAHARALRTSADSAAPRPVAWSMINMACQDRVIALEYALAATAQPLADTPPPMVGEELTLQRVQELASTPTFDAASINVAGPLVTYQTLVGPTGDPLPGEPDFWFWPYHHGVVINVEGELRVIDLSVGDVPLPIDTWLAGFVADDTPCPHLSEQDFQDVWVYWNSAFNNFEVEAPPQQLCGYTVTPIFTFRWDQTPADLLDFIASVPATMNVQLEGFSYFLEQHQTTLSEEERSLVTSQYQPGTVAEVCARTQMKFCAGL